MSYTDGNDHALHIQHHKPPNRLRIDRMTRAHTRTRTHIHAHACTHTHTHTHTHRWDAQGSDPWKRSVIPAAVCFRWTETVKTACRQSLQVPSSRQNPMGSPKTWLPWNCTHVPAVSQSVHSQQLYHFFFRCMLLLLLFWGGVTSLLAINILRKFPKRAQKVL